MTNTANFSWFDLSKYDAVETFDIDDWYFQLDKRRIIHMFSKKNPETIKRISKSRWEFMNDQTKKYIALIKEEPLLINEKRKKSALSVRDASYFDLHMAGYKNKNLKNVFNLIENEILHEIGETLVIAQSESGSPYDRAMLTIDLGATDEQLKKDFGEWLKNHRAISKYPVKEKGFTSKEFQKWIGNKVLPYLDLTLIADAEDKQLTHNNLGRLLFPKEYDVDLAERIRRTVKPIAENLLKKETLEALNIQVRAS